MTTDATTPTETLAAELKPVRTRRAKPDAAPSAARAPAAEPAGKTTTKSDTVIKLLLRTKGATPIELIAATDWQPHSLRAFLSGLRKKGRTIVREVRKSGEETYRIILSASVAPAVAAEDPLSHDSQPATDVPAADGSAA